jgi:hypothetical protein
MTERTKGRGVLTLAFGEERFINMAKALARSLSIHDPDVPRAIVTDSEDPELRDLFTYCIPYRTEYGGNVRQKMYLDLYSPFDETLFIDSDCLVVHNLDPFWAAFREVPFGVCGNPRVLRAGEEDEYLDVDFLLQRFSLDGLPKFNGGTYYFKRSPEASAVFETGRALLEDYRALRFKEFRGGGPPDEPLYSTAMAIHGLSITYMGEGGMFTPINSSGPIVLDVLRGVCHFVKEGRPVKPHVIHFATVWSEIYLYRRESLRLLKFSQSPARGISAADPSLLEVGRLWVERIQERIPRLFRGVMRRVRARTAGARGRIGVSQAR